MGIGETFFKFADFSETKERVLNAVKIQDMPFGNMAPDPSRS